ncbi:MAG TPA: YihY/virulence factor BrkB family protein [Dehalococcoidia bacterium]|nr:YihY/virulence factor BrkB family protein [Dehalococcoidia bacterium]
MVVKRLLFFVIMMKQAVHEFLTDNCTHLAAAISYYLLLSLFPLLLAAITILSFVSRDPNIEAKVTQTIAEIVPVSGDFISATIKEVSLGVGAAGAIATIGLIWTGMAVFNAIRKSLNTAWGIKTPRSFMRERLIELLMMVGFGALLLVSIGVTTAFKIVRGANISIFGQQLADVGFIWQALIVLASTIIAFIAFLFLYKFIPNTNARWRYVWLGALVAAILFEIVKDIFVWFVGHFATYNLVYGTTGTIIALMSWSYISAVIMLFCAKLISIYPRMKSSGVTYPSFIPDIIRTGDNIPLNLAFWKKLPGILRKQTAANPKQNEKDLEQSKPRESKITPSKADLRQ